MGPSGSWWFTNNPALTLGCDTFLPKLIKTVKTVSNMSRICKNHEINSFCQFVKTVEAWALKTTVLPVLTINKPLKPAKITLVFSRLGQDQAKQGFHWSWHELQTKQSFRPNRACQPRSFLENTTIRNKCNVTGSSP